jgi:hypothetical protein
MRYRRGKHRAESRPEDPQAQWEAMETDRAASRQLEAAHDRQSEISELTDMLKRIRERNHFGEMVRKALG